MASTKTDLVFRLLTRGKEAKISLSFKARVNTPKIKAELRTANEEQLTFL